MGHLYVEMDSLKKVLVTPSTMLIGIRSLFTLWILGAICALAAKASAADQSPDKPDHIVSLSLASDEILIDLMEKCGGRARIAALSIFADDADASSVVSQAKSIKGRVHSEPESLLQLKPDLVFAASFNRAELLAMIRSRKIPVVELSKFENGLDIANNIKLIGESVHCPSQAIQMRDLFLKKIAPIISNQKLRLLLYSADLTMMGGQTLFDDLIQRAGAINAAAEKGLLHWPRIEAETLLSMNPDRIIVLGQDTPEIRHEIAKHPVWGKMAAVKGQNFWFLDRKTAMSTSHYFAEAVESLQQKIRNAGH